MGYWVIKLNEQKYKIINQLRFSPVFMSSSRIKMAAPDIAEATEKK